MKIIKRDGREVPYDYEKIKNAIEAANSEVAEEDRLSDTMVGFIVGRIEKRIEAAGRSVSVEEIQDMVIDELDQAEAHRLARHYSDYRLHHELLRKQNSTDAKILSLLRHDNELAKQENANKDPILNSTMRDYLASEVSEDICRRYIFPEDVIRAHDEGIIHIHDMGYVSGPISNCFARETKFVTDKGIRAFADFKDGDEVIVKDKDGAFRPAIVHNYGIQPLQDVILKCCRTEKTIVCTPNHRWILSDGMITTSLKVGDRLYPTPDTTGWHIETKQDAEMFCLGFCIGDGCDHPYDGGNWGGQMSARLCGKKTKYVDVFLKAGYKISAIKGSDDVIATTMGVYKQDFLDGSAWKYMSIHDRILVFHGLYAADGNSRSHNITTSDERVAKFIEDVSGLAGYYITSKTDQIHDTPYKPGARLIQYCFRSYNLVNQMWVVKEIKPHRTSNGNLSKEKTVWCVEEPVTHTFTLECGIVTGNCELVNLEDMLQNGTVITDTLIEKPHSFSTACNIATQIIAQVASNTYGGQTISLAHLAPFVDVSRQKYKREIREELEAIGREYTEAEISRMAEKRVKKEVERGVQTIQYQIQTLLTTNGQTPFVSVFMYLDEVPAGQTRDDLALIIAETLKQRHEGIKNEVGVWVTPAFPKLLYVLDEDNITEDAPYWYLTVLAAECAAKRMVPDFISAKMMRELKQGDIYPCMGCRAWLTVDTKGLNPDDSHKYYGRFNQGAVTINLVDAACSSDGDEEQFWKLMEERTELCHKALRIRHETLLGTPSDVAPILWQYGAISRLKKGEKIDRLLYDNYSTISLGYAGLSECVYRMKGCSHTDPAGHDFGIEVMKFLNKKTAQWREAENISYSLYGTPMESTTYKFAQCLQRRFGKIEHVTDKNYITNSYHVHVTEPIDAFEKLGFEAEFQALSPGGAISYVEVPNLQNNILAVLSVMRFIYDNIMYAELNTKSDYCQVCGFDGEIRIVEEDGKLIWECPNCGNRDQKRMNVCRRVCGYLGTQYFNQGRTAEIADRVMHLSTR